MTVAYKTKDKATGNLDAGINASTLSIPLETSQGANFPQPYSGSATSLGSSSTLNSTGIGASGIVVGDHIHNVTDNSWATVEAVAADSITTSKLKGGLDNTWQNADVWCVNGFLLTLAALNSDGDDSAYEEVLISGRSTDTLTVPTGGRGYNGTVAQSFNAGDKAQLRVTSPIVEEIKKIIRHVNKQVDTNTDGLSSLISDLASNANGEGASLIGVEDDGEYYSSTNVEGVLQEVGASLAQAVTLSQIGLYGDGSDGSPDWSAGASLNPSTEKRYTSNTLPSGQTLTVSSVNTPLVLHTTGNVVVEGTVDLNGKGGAGGAGRTGVGVGNDGIPGHSLISGWNNGAGTGGPNSASPGGGGAGASWDADGGAPSTTNDEGTSGTKIDADKYAFLASIMRGVVCGGGGGSGAVNGGGSSGNAGNGGGALLWLIGGNLTLGASSIIRANGENAVAASGTTSGQTAAGSGGGGGGMIIILVAGSITNGGVTVSATGGAGSQSHGSGASNNNQLGGTGPNGRVFIYSLSTGTLITA